MGGYGGIGGCPYNTMDLLYEREFGPPLEARKKVAKALCEKFENIPGLVGLGPDEDAEAVYFSLVWHFRGKKIQTKSFTVRISPLREYQKVTPDQEAAALLAANAIPLMLGKFFLQFGGWLNVRRWPPCQKCQAVDITIDVARSDFDSENVAYFPIFKQEHDCSEKE